VKKFLAHLILIPFGLALFPLVFFICVGMGLSLIVRWAFNTLELTT
jgi:hypothetical protein